MIKLRAQLATRVKKKKHDTKVKRPGTLQYIEDSWCTPYIKLGGNEDDAVSLKSVCLFIRR